MQNNNANTNVLMIEDLALNANMATQYAFYTNSMILNMLDNVPAFQDAEYYLRYQAIIMGNNLNRLILKNNNTDIATPGTRLAALLNQNVTQIMAFVNEAKNIGHVFVGNPSLGNIDNRLEPYIVPMLNTSQAIAELATAAGRNRVTVSNGLLFLNRYVYVVVTIVGYILLKEYSQSLKYQAVLQAIGLGIGDYLTRSIFGGPVINFEINRDEYSGYSVPENVSLQQLRSLTNG